MSDTGNENMTVSGAIALAIALYRDGRFKEALRLCDDILDTVPDQTDILQLAGGLASNLGEHPRAAGYLIALLKLDPGNAPAHNDLGGALGALGQWEDAVAAHRRAIGIDPAYAEAYNNLGAALAALTLFEPAKAAYFKAIELDPGFTKAHNNLGILLFAHGDFQASLEFCTRALEIDPGYAKAHGALGNALHGLGRVDEAISAYRRAIGIDPNLAEAHNSLGNAMKLRGDYEKALASYRRAIEINPGYASAHYNLGNAQHDLGNFESSVASLEKCRALDNSPGVAVRLALLSPIIAASSEQIKTVRENVEAALDDLTNQGLRIADPCIETRFTNFLFAYHGLDDRPLQEKIAAFYLRACPDLAWTAPHCEKTPAQGKVRLGIISAHFTGHTVAKLFGGVIGNLSSDRLEVVLFDAKGTGVAETYGNDVDKV
ncbi:MAG TPA: glycosyltransferase family 41 protein, partial [Rhodospirillales bacterium]|nr:glycosyltransferase family 41 protein [Rhodospirillales bacterium]